MENIEIMAIDIDSTLAKGIVEAHLTEYNGWFNLGMTPAEISRADRAYPTVFEVPQIARLRKERKEEFEEIRKIIRNSPELHLGLQPMDYSRQGVNELLTESEMGGYYTVRPKAIEIATKVWLDAHLFPSPNNAVLCDDSKDKLRLVTENLIVPNYDNPNSKVVLIDDGFDGLVNAASQLVEENHDYRDLFRQLVIVGFGPFVGGTIRPEIGIHTTTLPSWRQNEVLHLKDYLRSLPNK